MRFRILSLPSIEHSIEALDITRLLVETYHTDCGCDKVWLKGETCRLEKSSKLERSAGEIASVLSNTKASFVSSHKALDDNSLSALWPRYGFRRNRDGILSLYKYVRYIGMEIVPAV